VECEECTELLFDYYDDELNANLKSQVKEHLEKCFSCQNELASILSTVNFLRVNMPVLAVDSCFTEKVMDKIDIEETVSTFIRPMERIGLVVVILTLGMLFVVGPTIIGLLMLIGNILLGLLSTATVVFAAFPIIQISSSIILGVLLLLVTVYMRNMVLHDTL
jgi:anti-sigma factor RsiW